MAGRETPSAGAAGRPRAAGFTPIPDRPYRPRLLSGHHPARCQRMNAQYRCPRCEHTRSLPVEVEGYEILCAECGRLFVARNGAVPPTPLPVAEPAPPAPDGDLRAFAPTRRDPPGPAPVEAAPPAQSPSAGSGQIGRFTFLAALGQRGFGRVYRAYDPQLDLAVALKVPKLTANQPRQAARFLQEARAAAGCATPTLSPSLRPARSARPSTSPRSSSRACLCRPGSAWGWRTSTRPLAGSVTWPRRWPTLTPPASCIGMSNPPTS